MDKKITLLKENLIKLNKAAIVLEETYNRCQEMMIDKDYNDNFELLTARFARISDFLINNILKLISKIEFEYCSTVKDLILWAEKNEIIEESSTIMEIKELRNIIAHEYAIEQLVELCYEMRDCCIKTTFYNKALYNNKPRISKPCDLSRWGTKLKN